MKVRSIAKQSVERENGILKLFPRSFQAFEGQCAAPMGPRRAAPAQLLACLSHSLAGAMQLVLCSFELKTAHGVFGQGRVSQSFLEIQLFRCRGFAERAGFVEPFSLFDGEPAKGGAPSLRLMRILNELKGFRNFPEILVD